MPHIISAQISFSACALNACGTYMLCVLTTSASSSVVDEGEPVLWYYALANVVLYTCSFVGYRRSWRMSLGTRLQWWVLHAFHWVIWLHNHIDLIALQPKKVLNTNHMTSSQSDHLKRVTYRCINHVMLTFPCIKTLGRRASCRAQEPSFAKGTRWELKHLKRTWRYVTRYKVLGWVNNDLERG